MKSIKNKLILVVIVVVGFIVYNYFALIPLNLRYSTSLFTFLVIFNLLYGLFNIKDMLSLKQNVYVDGNVIKNVGMFTNKVGRMIALSFIVYFLIGISSTPVLFSKQYHELIGEVESGDFTSNFTEAITNQLPIVDSELAIKLGDKRLGEGGSIGSEFYVGKYSDVVVNGKLATVAPLEYRGFFKWLNNRNVGVPGYIYIDKTTGDVQLVRSVNSNELRIKYVHSAYFSQDLMRKAYFGKNHDNRLYESFFEVDDDLNPFWVIVKTKKNIFINGGDDVKSVVTVNAQTGEVNEYLPEEAPAWIDNIYPKNLVMNQLNDWGYYINGFLNTLFGEKGILISTQGSRRVYNEGLYHYTGLTSIGSDESTVGFAFINTRTKKTTFYDMDGATELAAMGSAEGQVENYGYRATFPVPLNISGEPSYFVTLKDNKGLIKQYAFVNISDYSKVGNGETISIALQEYFKHLEINNNITDNEVTDTFSLVIDRIGSSIIDNNTYYYVLATIDLEQRIFVIRADISDELAVTLPGDNVTIELAKDKVVSFDNEGIE